MEKKMKATKTKLNIQFKLIDSGTPNLSLSRSVNTLNW